MCFTSRSFLFHSVLKVENNSYLVLLKDLQKQKPARLHKDAKRSVCLSVSLSLCLFVSLSSFDHDSAVLSFCALSVFSQSLPSSLFLFFLVVSLSFLLLLYTVGVSPRLPPGWCFFYLENGTPREGGDLTLQNIKSMISFIRHETDQDLILETRLILCTS